MSDGYELKYNGEDDKSTTAEEMKASLSCQLAGRQAVSKQLLRLD